MQVKDGAAWAALEYMKYARESKNPSYLPPKIIVAGIAYFAKAKYRSSVVIEWVSNVICIEKALMQL